MAEPLTIEQIKANISDKFEENYARLRLDGGHFETRVITA